MATSVIRNVLYQAPGVPSPRYVPLVPQHRPHTPSTQGVLGEAEEAQGETRETRGDAAEPEDELMEEEEEEDDDDDDDDDDVDCESEVQEGEEEEEEGQESRGFRAAAASPPQPAVDMTRQLLSFADLISSDVQRYFGRAGAGGAQEAGGAHGGDPPPVTPTGRLRYYDDLLKIARTESPEDREPAHRDGPRDGGASALGPLAELFDRSRLTRGCSRPMVKRHLPLSFWTEPVPCRAAPTDPDRAGVGVEGGAAHAALDAHEHHRGHAETHALDNAHPDFSDLLAHWDPNPDLPHTL